MSKSVYKYAAEAGLPVGLYLSLMSACFLLSLEAPFLPTLLLPLAIGFPFLLAWHMRRMGRAEPSYMRVSALWLCGIYTVIFGTLICCLLSALYLVAVDPGFLGRYVSEALATIESGPAASQYADTAELIRKALDSKMVPTPTEFVSTMGWLTCFSGSVLSLVIAMILSATSRRASAGMWR